MNTRSTPGLVAYSEPPLDDFALAFASASLPYNVVMVALLVPLMETGGGFPTYSTPGTRDARDACAFALASASFPYSALTAALFSSVAGTAEGLKICSTPGFVARSELPADAMAFAFASFSYKVLIVVPFLLTCSTPGALTGSVLPPPAFALALASASFPYKVSIAAMLLLLGLKGGLPVLSLDRLGSGLVSSPAKLSSSLIR
mmetsp:Transcript_1807/g.4088  ORF Transcript_1807/g.4088 Transcript_1807/m.4088 type:complete len:203 (+) Transcript_1807:2159-2767(+)